MNIFDQRYLGLPCYSSIGPAKAICYKNVTEKMYKKVLTIARGSCNMCTDERETVGPTADLPIFKLYGCIRTTGLDKL